MMVAERHATWTQLSLIVNTPINVRFQGNLMALIKISHQNRVGSLGGHFEVQWIDGRLPPLIIYIDLSLSTVVLFAKSHTPHVTPTKQKCPTFFYIQWRLCTPIHTWNWFYICVPLISHTTYASIYTYLSHNWTLLTSMYEHSMYCIYIWREIQIVVANTCSQLNMYRLWGLHMKIHHITRLWKCIWWQNCYATMNTNRYIRMLYLYLWK